MPILRMKRRICISIGRVFEHLCQKRTWKYFKKKKKKTSNYETAANIQDRKLFPTKFAEIEYQYGIEHLIDVISQ